MKKFFALLILFSCSTAAADGIPKAVEIALNNPDKLIVYSISPQKTPGGPLRGYAILSHTPINKRKNINLITSTILKSIKDGGRQAFCFEPHHAIRVFKEKQMYDFIICYACASYSIYVGQSVGGGPIAGDRRFLDQFLLHTRKAEQDAASNP